MIKIMKILFTLVITGNDIKHDNQQYCAVPRWRIG